MAIPTLRLSRRWVVVSLAIGYWLLAIAPLAAPAEPASAPAPEEAHQWISNAELQDRLQRLYSGRAYPEFDVAA
ncbi:MAG: hypothetical protein NTW86_01815, partial [Candidatus Sumerlaeota bacterium]|nr:hypothetical protein [Candidatus Sumerlaeota bacterium]